MTDDTQEPKVWPPHKYAFEELSKGELRYDAVIKWERFEGLLGVKRTGVTEWKFRGEWMSLTRLVKEAGFLFTERGMHDKGVRVLSRDEMADTVRQRELGKANDSLRNSLMLSNVPRENLSLSDIKKLDHWETKAAVVGATAKVLLRKRNLPSPEMAVKSVRQLAVNDPDEGDADPSEPSTSK